MWLNRGSEKKGGVMKKEEKAQGCQPFHDLIPKYCFGDPISADDRNNLEAHILDCDLCCQEVIDLSSAVDVLRNSPEAKQEAQRVMDQPRSKQKDH